MKYDLVVIGGGPAGLSASIEAKKHGSNVLLIERESRLGGILKQCIHDGFGLIHFKEKLTGPEYAGRLIDEFHKLKIEYKLLSFVTKIDKYDEGFKIHLITKEGMELIDTYKIILSTGCRERSSKQVSIHGDRPYGVLSAGSCQNLVNIQGVMPTKKCVILGSGDIGLIMARRLTLEGAKVLGVYEIKPTPSGLSRNIHQCLIDFNIPLYLSKTVTRVFGKDRLEAVEIMDVDKSMKVIKGTEQIIECDMLLLSVGLIPENELAESIGVTLDNRAKGPKCDQNFETLVDNCYTCGNATHVNDLADYVSESAEIAGLSSTIKNDKERVLIDIKNTGKALYIVPEMININSDYSNTTMYFRSSKDLSNATLNIKVDNNIILTKKYSKLRPPEMERITINFENLNKESNIEFILEGDE